MAWKQYRWVKILILLTALGVYGFALHQNAREGSFRSLQMKDDTTSPAHVLINVTVTNVDTASRQLNAQFGFRFYGNIAEDEVTPKTDLKLLINNIGGQQEFNSPKGKRMNRIEAAFPLDGDLNRYPFDSYKTTVSFLMTPPRPAEQPAKA